MLLPQTRVEHMEGERSTAGGVAGEAQNQCPFLLWSSKSADKDRGMQGHNMVSLVLEESVFRAEWNMQ